MATISSRSPSVFQSTPAITGGRDLHCPLMHPRSHQRFNPRPPLLAGETWTSASRQRRPEFQSTPAITGGRDAWHCASCTARFCFNPRPPLLAGETIGGRNATKSAIVLIHARHYWRARRLRRCAGDLPQQVSIHARHYWRARRALADLAGIPRLVSIHARHYWRARPNPPNLTIKPCMRRKDEV